MNKSISLLIHCPDKKGLVAIITEFIYKNNGNILYLDQHVDPHKKVFFMRVEWELSGFNIPPSKIKDYFKTLIADQLDLNWKIYFSDEIPKMAIFASKSSHCLYDILSRYQDGEYQIEIPLIISNHQNLEPIAQRFNIPYFYFPIKKDNKLEVELKQLAILNEHNINFIVLARYMQILSPDFISHYRDKIINIHHSFLPAFPGAKPYHSAFEKGVKIIGATSHYVSEELDNGPIIEQDVVRISHRDSIEDLIRKGQDLEKVVLGRAIWLHLKRKILIYNNRSIVFD